MTAKLVASSNGPTCNDRNDHVLFHFDWNFINLGSLKAIISNSLSLYHEESNSINYIRMFICLLVFTSKTTSQTVEIKVRLPKLVLSKSIQKSKAPILYYSNCSAAQRLVLSGDIERILGHAEADYL